MAADKPRNRRWMGGLRPRLTISYVLFFTALLAFLGLFFRATLQGIYQKQVRDLLSEEWGAIRGYLRIEKGKVVWFYDTKDPDETFTVERLRRVYLLTADHGAVIEVSPEYQKIGIDSPDHIRDVLRSKTPVWSIREGGGGADFIVRSGLLIEGDRQYYLSIGRSLAESNRVVDQFTRNYFMLLPVMIAMASIFGWHVAGRALRPLNDLAGTAQRITGSNLSAHIPARGTGDELDRLIESFNRMIVRLDESFTQTRQFSTDVSHELRTPLTAIRGQLEVALFTAKTEEEYRNAISDALEDVDRLTHTIRSLLLLSQAESGQVLLQKQRIDLTAIATDIVEQFQIPAEAAQVRLMADLHGSCIVDADRIQIERLITNLLSNAIKYTEPGGRVRVGVERDGAAARLTVSDSGIGITADHLPHIFDRFYRVPGADRSPDRGLGLGLSFVSWIVKAHRGRIDVRSTPGQGTSFEVVLPAAEASAAPEAAVAWERGSEG